MAGYRPPLPPCDTTTAACAAVSMNGSSAAVYILVSIADTGRPEVESTTETGNRASAANNSGKTRIGPELPRLIKTFGFGSAHIRPHQPGFGVEDAQLQIPT